ncbi:MAG: DUF1501 domain-containing protein [Acidothermaceae bacterium]
MPRPMSRRQFLISSGVVGAAAIAAGATGYTMRDVVAAGKQNPLPAGTKILVLVTMYGGNDGLNTVVPYTDKAYYSSRPELAYQQSEILPLADGLGLNPSMTNFKKAYDAGQLAVVRGVGYPNADRSHFKSMAIWQTASPDTPQSTGWLGRWLDANGSDPLLAVNVGPVLPPLLAGQKCAGAALPSSGGISLPSGRFGSGLRALDTVATDQQPLESRVAQSGVDLFRVAQTFGTALSTMPLAAASPGTSSNGAAAAGAANDLAGQLDVVARCIAANAPTRVYSVQVGGFDTHADEKATQSRLLGQLDAAVSGFLTTISAGSRGDDVVVALYSEFGRRVAANASQGTDHGTASNVFVIGTNVHGGMYGEQPSLTDLSLDDLKYNVDFRSVYATLLERVLGADASQVLGSGSFGSLTFV